MKLGARLLAAAAWTASLLAAPAMAAGPLVGLITKTDANPFFVKIEEAAREKAGALGLELRAFAGRYDGDSGPQIEAIQRLVAAGAKGILITPSDPASLAGAVAMARAAGVLVVALDTPFDSVDAVDATFATDNFKAGEWIGQWARATLGAAASRARIAMLDLSDAQVTVNVARNQGFLKGFGIDIRDPGKMYDEDDARIVGAGASLGTEEGGRAAMEALLRRAPSVDVVYTINEPAAAGVHAALKAAGRAGDVLIVSVDGGCAGVRNVAAGAIGATAMQYPVRMAVRGLDAVAAFARTGKRPEKPAGRDFHDTGVALVTDRPVPGIPSISVERGLRECW